MKKLFLYAALPLSFYFGHSQSATPPPLNCGSVFMDNGGTQNYQDNSMQTTTICPDMPGSMVTVTFSSFSTQPGDILTIISGPTPTGVILGSFSGNNLPPAITSITADGCLTFVFTSDATGNSDGWLANISCTPVICNPPINVTVNSITNTSAVINWTYAGSSVLSEIIILPFGSPPPADSTAGVYVQSNSYVATGLTPNSCYTAYVRSLCVPGGPSNANSAWSVPVDFCMYDCANNAQCLESLTLVAFVDANNNGTKEAGEVDFMGGNFVYEINNSGNPIYANSNNGNFYIFENNPANIYSLGFVVNSELASYFSSSAAYTNVTVPTGSGNTAYYFPVTQLQPYNDLEVYIVAGGNPRPGFTYSNYIYYKNKGMQAVNSGTLTFNKSATVSITNISQTGTATTPTGFTYAFSNLAPNETRFIQVTMQVPTIPTVSLGQTVTNAASIEPLIGDSVPGDNHASISQNIVGSYDPNDKMEAHGEKIDIDDFSSNDYLAYTIRFENTGTASADFIRIEDLLDTSLNAGSVVILNASHPVDVRRIGNRLIWNFYDINLPPTATSPTLSHGYVQFKVKPNPGYVIGDIVPNQAEIYFDYNPPIITNRFETEFVDVLGNANFESLDFILYPNPARTSFAVSLRNPSEIIQSISITNVLGKTAKTVKNGTSGQVTVDVSGLSPGMYFVEITTHSNLKMIKKLIIN